MSRRLPDNLAKLYDTYGKESIDRIGGPADRFEIDGIEFICQYAPESTPERFHIVKPLSFVEWYRGIAERFRGGTIFELGIAEGGSTALLTLLAEPRKLIAIDNEEQRLDALDEFLAARDASDAVRPYYGVDQSDRNRLREIVDLELDDEPLDLVIDDASHVYDLTLASFETLFPYLRPGGLYIIEDWNADPRFMDAVVKAMQEGRAPRTPDGDTAAGAGGGSVHTDRDPLCRIGLELVLAAASADAAVAEVAVDDQVITVTRGDTELGDEFTLDGAFRDYFKLLSPRHDDR